MLLEEKYPHLKGSSRSEWRVVAVRSLIFVLLSILITAAAYLYGPKRSGDKRTGVPSNAASTRGERAPDAPEF